MSITGRNITIRGAIFPAVDIEVNGTPEGQVPAGSTLDIQVKDFQGNIVTPTSVDLVNGVLELEVAVGSPQLGRMPLKSGQITSYTDNDDGDNQAGRAIDFFTLDYDNPFGNNQRLAGLTGGYYDISDSEFKDINGNNTTRALAFPDDIVCDFSTLNIDGNFLMFNSQAIALGNQQWLIMMDIIKNMVHGGFDDWRPTQKNEIVPLAYEEDRNIFPLWLFDVYGVWLGTTDSFFTNNAFDYFRGTIRTREKTGGGRHFMVRTAHISELNL